MIEFLVNIGRDARGENPSSAKRLTLSSMMKGAALLTDVRTHFVDLYNENVSASRSLSGMCLTHANSSFLSLSLS